MSPPEARTPPSRFLVVSDDPGVADRFARLLRLEGHEVWAASNGEAARELARTHHPDAVVLNLRLPLAGAATLLDAIRKAVERDLATAIVTGDYRARPADREALARHGVELRYQPFWLHELVQLARELVEVPAGA